MSDASAPLSSSGGGLRAAIGLLTVCGGAADLHPRAPVWYGLVGAALGGVLGGVWWLTGELFPPFVAALVVVSLDAGLTGMLHLDGLADTADGLLPPIPRPRRLAIMRGPEVGAFGVVVLVLALTARVVALGSIPVTPLLLVGLWALSRGAMAATALAAPYARSGEGMGASLSQRRACLGGALIGGVIGTVALALVGRAGAAALVGALLAAVGTVVLARRRLGGYTGDVLGAVGVLTETVGLLAATINR
ncbi:MAG: adenosylcobinamide-GDP ribazoletransferase [Acidimicrobiales bacterium]